MATGYLEFLMKLKINIILKAMLIMFHEKETVGSPSIQTWTSFKNFID